jgi:protein SCO1/2
MGTAGRSFALVVTCLLGLTVVSARPVLAASGGSDTLRQAPQLPEEGRLPDFSLINQHAQPVTREGLVGCVWVAGFIFTRCAGQCPLMSAEMSRLQQAFDGAPDLRLVAFTVDPAYDTPEVLAAYAARYGAHAGRWHFLTGEREAIVTLAREGFRLGVSEERTSEEPITHSVRFALVDQQGHVRGSYDATDAEAMQRLRADLARLLGEGAAADRTTSSARAVTGRATSRSGTESDRAASDVSSAQRTMAR